MTESRPADPHPRPRRTVVIRKVVVAASWLPAVWLAGTYFLFPVSPDPIQYAERFSGQVAIIMLIGSLACTPLVTYLQFRDASALRKPLGLFAFFYSSIHFLIYSGLDFAFDLQFLADDVFSKAYLLVGTLALIILLPLAATSFKPVKKSMGRKWKRLHMLVYPTGILAALHYSWAKKGDLLSLSGEQFFPALAMLLIILLLILRLPMIKRVLLPRAEHRQDSTASMNQPSSNQLP
jgi:sulfoxide reductase heme-binding subunit YedZ